jgi:hypothetical protein
LLYAVARGVLVFSLAAMAGVATLATTGAGAAPSPFRLVFDGAHRPATFPSATGLQHEGPFTASAPFCASGYAVDLRHLVLRQGPVAVRRYSCGDGSGSITAHIEMFPAEHVLGSSEPWRIVAGTGLYAKLRGKGMWTSLSVNGDQSNPASLTFRTEWRGVVDFDNVAPLLSVSKASARKLARPRGVYLLRLSLSAHDDVDGNAVFWKLNVRTRSFGLASKAGKTSSGTVVVSMRVHPARGTRKLLIEIAASDPVGNKRTHVRSIPLPLSS